MTGFEVDRFAWPWAFGLLVVVVVLAVWLLVRRRTRRAGLPVPMSPGSIGGLGTTWRTRTRWVPGALRVFILALLAVAIARPQEVRGESESSTEGVAIQILVDRSSSMAEGMRYEGKLVTRLDAVKRVAADFVMGNGHDLPGREGDLVGLISFARFADTVCPLVRNHDALSELLGKVELVTPRSPEDGTAIGEAVALAAARLRDADEQFAHKNKSGDESLVIKSKVIVLLTDGENTAGGVDPVSAARLAAEWGVKIYAIGIGDNERRGFFSRGGVDERLLKRLADETGGEAYLVRNSSELEQVYDRIDSLEKTRIETDEYTNVIERVTPIMVLVGCLLLGELFAQWFVYRRVA